MILRLTTFLVGFISLVKSAVGSGSSGGVGSGEFWNSRNLEAYFSRLGARIDQLVLRFDHLDSRMNRFTSLIQGRLDGVENSLSTTKLKMDLWGEELSRIEEQLTRKWKNVEAKLELLVPAIEAKLENKVTLIQRDNRRQTEHLSSILIGLGQRFDTKADAIWTAVTQHKNTTSRSVCEPDQVADRVTSTLPPVTSTVHISDDSWIDVIEGLTNKTEELIKSNTAIGLISTKVTNMFEDLIQRSNSLQTEVKDGVAIANATRKEVQETFRSLTHSRLRHTLAPSGTMTSSETMSAVIVEALASVESMSTALGRRMLELSRSIDGRFEIVSNALNGFLDSCLRIQEGTPLIEEHIASILEKMLDGIENTTRAGHEETTGLGRKLDDLKVTLGTCGTRTTTSFVEGSEVTPTLVPYPTVTTDVIDPNKFRTAEILQNSQDLTEDEKKSLWESLFPNQVPD